MIKRLRATQKLAKEHIREAKQKAKNYADKNTNTKTFKVGDKVLLHEAVRRERLKKLEAPWIGPYQIIEKTSDVNYKIKQK
ncbi:hypothetical protein P5V15_004276 [Pogonomyrmex californicus]